MEPRRPGKLELLLATLSTGAMVWFMMPAQERMWVRLRTVAGLRRAAARLASLEGHAGMGDELAGRDPSARYGGAVMLGKMRDLLDKAAEAMRP